MNNVFNQWDIHNTWDANEIMYRMPGFNQIYLTNFVNASKDWQKNFISFQLKIMKSDFCYFWNDVNR